ncbi:MAG: ABC transporter substrate-binding protein [Proteobacteria bacterium]|nr:ABC transporter substrate-binding protein [Pseudomonadota bacterium]
MRIISLTCSNTEIVCALDCSHYLIAVDDHSDYPKDVVSALPRVGPDLGIDIEKVNALQPDLVLASLTVPGHEKIIEGLDNAGLNYLAPEPTSLQDIYEDIYTIADAIGAKAKAEQIVANMRHEISPVNNNIKPSILVQWWPKPVISPGKLSWVNGLMVAAGAHNPLIDRDVKSSPLEDKEVAELNPEAIAISWCGVKPEKYRPEVIYRNEAWQGLDAIINRRVYCIPEAYLGRPSPRVIDGYRALRKIVEDLQDC